MSLIYHEKGDGLHRRLAESGVTLYKLDGAWRVRGATEVEAQTIIDAFDPDGPDGEPERQRCLDEIDRLAAGARRRFITDIPYQAQIYETKAAEAAALKSDSAAPAPFIRAEATARGVAVSIVIAEIDAARARWNETAAPAIEAARMRYKSLIRSRSFTTHADLIEQARTAFDAII